MKQSQFVDALTNDIEGGAGAGPLNLVTDEVTKKGTTDGEGDQATGDESGKTETKPQASAASAIDEMQEKLR